MKKIRATVSVLSLVLFLVSAVTGLVMWLMPHPHNIPSDAMKVAEDVVRSVGERSKDGFNWKEIHEISSLVLTAVIVAHMVFNWKTLMSYILPKNS